MAFKKLVGCDKSDMGIWARSNASKNFITEIVQMKESSVRKLIKEPTEEHAAEVRAFTKILSLIEECQRMN